MLILIKGKNDFLVKRSFVDEIRNLQDKAPDSDVVSLNPLEYKKGDLDIALSPSLLSASQIVSIEIVSGAKGNGFSELTDDLIEDIVDLVDSIEKNSINDPNVVISHPGIVRGSKMVKAIESAGNRSNHVKVIQIEDIKDSQRPAFVAAEFRKFGKNIANDASIALVDAVGDNLAELVNFARQISNDIPEEKVTVSKADINSYFKSFRQIDVYDIVNPAFMKKTELAIENWRMAYQNDGYKLIPGLLGAFASKLRLVAKVSSGMSYTECKISSWQYNDTKKFCSSFSENKFAKCFEMLASANFGSIGGFDSDKGQLSVEKLIIEISR